MIIDGIRTHTKKDCVAPCPFHAPSEHPLNKAKIHIRLDKGGLVERICEHGIGHDDPDSVAYMHKQGHTWAGVHGCDGCCTPELSEKEKLRNKVVSWITMYDTEGYSNGDSESERLLNEAVNEAMEYIEEYSLKTKDVK